MTGGSLGIRSSLSYGSLQLYNNPSALLPNNSTQGSTAPSNRKVNSKMLFVGSREKERRFNLVGKVGSRRKIGMLLLFVASAAVLLSFFFALSRDVEQPVGPEAVVGYSDHIWNLVHRGISSNNISPPSKFSEDVINTTTLVSNTRNRNINNDTVLIPIVHSIKVPSQHPCQNFSLPPPIVDPKRTGPRPCDVCYVPEDIAMGYMPAFPSVSPVLRNLDFVAEENLLANESNGGSSFGGHPSLVQREKSYDIKESMTVYCGFANGKKPGLGTGFDMEEADLFEMEQCRGVVVASAIFGNYDIMQQPKNISTISRSTVCFYMFVDQETEASIKNSSVIDSGNKVGLWRVVVVRNLPYADARRNGKVPKLLLHRIFPNVRYSLWVDGKLELVVDPYQILERFLWRNNATFAISRHYRRFDVFEEAEANKAAGKYDNASIDNQVDFYRKEGLTHFSPAKYPITSDVPEGCVIIREHIPITNLFTCLWFNEVDRFTSRDQLSFSTVRDKIMSRVNWTVSMFLDCERRNFVVQGYHRDILEQKLASQKLRSGKASQSKPRTNLVLDPSKENSSERKKSTFDVMADVSITKPSQSRRQSSRRGKDRKAGSRRHRLKGAAAIARDVNLF